MFSFCRNSRNSETVYMRLTAVFLRTSQSCIFLILYYSDYQILGLKFYYVFFSVCGQPVYPSKRIVGGSQASFGEWPWQASLRQWRSVTYLHKCGAALVNENWAISAAHCVEKSVNIST